MTSDIYEETTYPVLTATTLTPANERAVKVISNLIVMKKTEIHNLPVHFFADMNPSTHTEALKIAVSSTIHVFLGIYFILIQINKSETI